MNGKVRIKFGAMEIDFEGSEQFLKDEFIELIKTVHSLAKDSGVNLFQPETFAGEVPKSSSVGLSSELGINTVAQKLDSKSGPDLVLAAAAKLTLIDKKEKFSTKDLLAEMRNATSYFKDTYSKNMTSSMNTLVKGGRLNDVGSGNYSIPAVHQESLISKLK
ncbi:MAG: hypothetical protein V4654_14155 [Bdellovibrionota bacterium]